MTYAFLQQYWWFVVSLLGALLVFLLFVQGGNSLLFCLGKTEEHKKLMVNSTGRKWEFTFTTLVTFGGAFFASFPLFYSTSFGGAYWLWMIILFSYVLQTVSNRSSIAGWSRCHVLYGLCVLCRQGKHDRYGDAGYQSLG